MLSRCPAFAPDVLTDAREAARLGWLLSEVEKSYILAHLER
jgi:hypothetical protein